MNKPRNLAARSPLMRKGGVHQRKNSSLRKSDRRMTLDEAFDYLEKREQNHSSENPNSPTSDSDFLFFSVQIDHLICI